MASVSSKSTGIDSTKLDISKSDLSSTIDVATQNASIHYKSSPNTSIDGESAEKALSTKTPLSVAEAKQQLRHNAATIDYLAPVKENPIQSVGISFFAGLLAGAEKTSALATSKVTSLVAKSLIQL